jgi:hypothetical protein
MSIQGQDVVTIVSILLVNVSDGATAADSIINVDMTSDISAVESPTIADSVIVATGDFEVSVTEQPTAADVVVDIAVSGGVEDEDVDVTEAPSIADTATAVADYEININDPPTVADVASAEFGSEIDVNEQPTIADVASAELLSDLYVDVSEAPTIADATTVDTGFEVNVSESPAISDVASVATAALEVDIAEQPTIADTVVDIQLSALPGEEVDVTEQPSVADSATVEVSALEVNVSESPTVSDTAEINFLDFTYNADITEQPSVADDATVSIEGVVGDENIDVNEQPTAQDYASVWIEGESPGIPTILGVDAIASNALRVRWQAVGGADYYNIYKSVDGSTYGLVGSTKEALVPTGTSFLSFGLTPSTLYYYKVTAVNTDGESPQSAAASNTTLVANLQQVVIADSKEFFFDANQYPNNLATMYSIYTEGDALIQGNFSVGGFSSLNSILYMNNNEINWMGAVEGAWRIIPSGNNLLVQRYQGGSWVTRYTFTP